MITFVINLYYLECKWGFGVLGFWGFGEGRVPEGGGVGFLPPIVLRLSVFSRYFQPTVSASCIDCHDAVATSMQTAMATSVVIFS